MLRQSCFIGIQKGIFVFMLRLPPRILGTVRVLLYFFRYPPNPTHHPIYRVLRVPHSTAVTYLCGLSGCSAEEQKCDIADLSRVTARPGETSSSLPQAYVVPYTISAEPSFGGASRAQSTQSHPHSIGTTSTFSSIFGEGCS